VLRITDQVDAGYLEQSPPRPLPLVVVMNLLGEYLFERPTSLIFAPTFLAGVAGFIAMAILQWPRYLLFLPLLLVAIHLGQEFYQAWRRTWDDLMLLRKGLRLRAHILRMRPHRDTLGQIDGALLDCAIVVSPRRTYLGSIWLADGIEALRLARQGRIEVICLPRTPGTWRVIEEVKSEVRYDRMGPVAQIPQDI
jgi:hypothetical protein